MPVQRLHCIYKEYVDFLNSDRSQEVQTGEMIQEQLEDAGVDI